MPRLNRGNRKSPIRTTASLIEARGATSSVAGTRGLVPAAAAGDEAKVLQGDGTWVDPTAALGLTGVVVPFAGSSAPTGWLLCYGQAVSRTTYATLYGVISTTYGVGDGSTTFNLPDLRGRAVGGKDDMGGSAANRLTAAATIDGTVLGTAGGSETHTLVTAELAAHTHGAGTYETVNNDVCRNPGTDTNNQTGGGGNIVKTVTQARISIQGTSGSSGSDTAHNNVQPTIILNYIIKT